MLEIQRSPLVGPVSWMKVESMPDGWKVPYTAAHKDITILSGWINKFVMLNVCHKIDGEIQIKFGIA